MVRKKYTRNEITLVVFCTIFIILILTFYVWHQMESVRIGYEEGELEDKVLNLRKEVEKLESAKSSLLSLENVEKIAKEELKLVKPKEKQIVYDDFNP
ncbi:MAG: cell division protein FtsL [Candidatus Aminicenantes bacterium]|nr:cell division protein FtsL [Candidatus Aminicenantes bacterium]MBL7082620.1 cell division protein FtsL [Candidatus Aminicenantes bacterium]